METQRHALVKRDYLVPFVLVTSLFFLWGFAHAILDVLNKHFQEVMDIVGELFSDYCFTASGR